MVVSAVSTSAATTDAGSDGLQPRHERFGPHPRREHAQHHQPARGLGDRPPPSTHPHLPDVPYGAGTEGVQRDRSRSPTDRRRGGTSPVSETRRRSVTSRPSKRGSAVRYEDPRSGVREGRTLAPVRNTNRPPRASLKQLPYGARHRGRDASVGRPCSADESLGGDGTPAVAAFTPEPFAPALGMSPSAGAQLVADALDLRHRLPDPLETGVQAARYLPGRPAGSPARPTASPRPRRAGSTNSSPHRVPAAP